MTIKVNTHEYMMHRMMQWILHRYGEDVLREMCELIGVDPDEAWR
jgi:energy-converting hydrogenase A subunit M